MPTKTEMQREEEIWQQEELYWGLLERYDLERWIGLWHDHGVAWPNGRPAPVDKPGVWDMMTRGASEVTSSTAGESVGAMRVTLKRLSVRLYGDTGVVYGEARIVTTTANGERQQDDERFVHTWLWSTEGWRIIGGMSANL